MGPSEMMDELGAERLLITNIFDVHLGQGKGLLGLPGPVVGRVAELAATAGLDEPLASEDAADGVGGERYARAVPQLPAEASSAIAGLLSQPDHLLLQSRAGLAGAGSGSGGGGPLSRLGPQSAAAIGALPGGWSATAGPSGRGSPSSDRSG